MRIDVFTLFPGLIDGFCSDSMLGRARQNELLDLRLHDPRRQTSDVHGTVDDAPFGGGAGMLMLPGPPVRRRRAGRPAPSVVPARPGRSTVRPGDGGRTRRDGGFSLLCGRYEGVDHRVREHLVDGELSVGDVVLNGGEVAACLVVEAVTRLLPGAMGNAESPVTESFGASGLLEEPHCTRPATFRGWEVPDVLRSGDHGRVARWRRAQALHRTIAAATRPHRRPRGNHR